MLSAGRGLTFFATIACLTVAVISQSSSSSPVDPVAAADAVSSTITPPSSRDLEDDAGEDAAIGDAAIGDAAIGDAAIGDSNALTTVSTVDALIEYMAKDLDPPSGK